jgi:hypothetical protein
MKQIYHPYWKWECHKNGMWRKETKDYEHEQINLIIRFTGNHIDYGTAMIDMINNWKYSPENFITNMSINRRAYVGHAACCYAYKWPEYLVRSAWSMLTEEQRFLANNQADIAIRQFEIRFKENKSNQFSLW